MSDAQRSVIIVLTGAMIGLVVAILIDLVGAKRIVLDLPTELVEPSRGSSPVVQYLGGGGGGGRLEGETTDLPSVRNVRLTLAHDPEPARLDVFLRANSKGTADLTFSVLDNRRLVSRQQSRRMRGYEPQSRVFAWTPQTSGRHTLELRIEDTKHQNNSFEWLLPLVDDGTVPRKGRDYPLLVNSALVGASFAAVARASFLARRKRKGSEIKVSV